MKLTFYSLLLFLITGCAISASVLKSGIKIDGENSSNNEFIYWINLDNINEFKLCPDGCSQYDERSFMMSFLVPLPPLVPTTKVDEVSKSEANFTIRITSETGANVDLDSVSISVTLGSDAYDFVYAETITNQYIPEFKAYRFKSSLKCGQILDGTLNIKGFDVDTIKYKINFYEGTELEVGYLQA